MCLPSKRDHVHSWTRCYSKSSNTALVLLNVFMLMLLSIAGAWQYMWPLWSVYSSLMSLTWLVARFTLSPSNRPMKFGRCWEWCSCEYRRERENENENENVRRTEKGERQNVGKEQGKSWPRWAVRRGVWASLCLHSPVTAHDVSVARPPTHLRILT